MPNVIKNNWISFSKSWRTTNMASINQINKYYNKYVFLKKDMNDYQKAEINRIESRLENNYKKIKNIF